MLLNMGQLRFATSSLPFISILFMDLTIDREGTEF